jgi:integrase
LKRAKFEPEVEEYLALKSKRTAQIYSSGLGKFLIFYQSKYGKDADFSHFLDRLFEEFKKPPRERSRVAEIEISQFIDYLRDQKLSNNSIRLYFAAVQNFLKYKQITVSMSFVNVPPPVEKRENGKHEWHIEQIKQFADAASNYRDKAIILCMFQSGLAVNEICALNYGDLQDEFERGVLPLCLKLVRQKTQVEFKTFFGRDAVKYLKLYLATRKDLKPKSPLFTKERARGGETRITPSVIQQSFSEIAKNVDFIKLKDDAYNPARPHSLRAAFNSQLIGKIDETLREFWMGHSIGGVAKSYLNMPTEDLRKLYMSAEEFLKIERSSREEMDETAKSKDMATMILEGKVKELEQRVKMHENIFKQMTEMSFEEFAKWMQDKNRWEWQQATEHEHREWKEQLKQTKESWEEEKKKKPKKT